MVLTIYLKVRHSQFYGIEMLGFVVVTNTFSKCSGIVNKCISCSDNRTRCLFRFRGVLFSMNLLNKGPRLVEALLCSNCIFQGCSRVPPYPSTPEEGNCIEPSLESFYGSNLWVAEITVFRIPWLES